MSLATILTERPTGEVNDDDETMPEVSPTPFPPLPHVVLRCIVYYLSDSLPTLLSVSSLSSNFQDICRPHTSSYFHTITKPVPPLSSAYYYHSLVQLVLERYLDPSFIFEIYLPKQPFGPSPPARSDLSDDAPERQQLCSFDRLLKQAVRKSPLIPADLESEVCARFQHGDRDAALAVLLPLCTRLKMLEVPGHSELCAAMFQSVAQEHRRRGTNAEEARRKASEAALRDRNGKPWRQKIASTPISDDALPFAELVVLYVSSHQHGYSFPLTTMIPFMGIPSLHRIILTALRDEEFPGWPAGDVECSCPHIYFQQSSVSKQVVLAFAQGVDAPCEIRQWYERPRPDVNDRDPGTPTWDRVLISRGTDGSKKVEARIDYEGGNPGYDHAWVSWLWHGKMQDWKRLDEEFSLEDGDADNEWLWGIFG